jgi:hypothetical protein
VEDVASAQRLRIRGVPAREFQAAVHVSFIRAPYNGAMNYLRLSLLLAAIVSCSAPAFAGGHKEGGKGSKHEYWEGNCKVKVKVGKHGEYKEKRECRGEPQVVYVPAPVVVQQPVLVAPPVVMGEPGLVIQSTVRIK